MLALQSFTADWKGLDLKVVGNAITGQDWRKAEGKVTLPTNAVRTAVMLMIQGPGIAWLDDFSLDGTDPGGGWTPSTRRSKSSRMGGRSACWTLVNAC